MTTQTKNPWWRRRWFVITASVVLCAVLAWLVVVPIVVESIVRRTLVALIRDHIDAEIQIGRVGYLPPYNVSVYGLRIIAKDHDGASIDLLAAKRVDLSLDRTDNPVIIDDLYVEAPTVRLIRNADGGFVGIRPGGTSSPTSQPSQQISKLFQLRQLDVRNAEVIFKDHATPNTSPMVWRNLKLTVSSSSGAPADYSFDLAGGDEKIGTIAAAGKLNVDDPHAQLDRCTLRIVTNPQGPDNALPPLVQALANENRSTGAITIDLNGQAPLAGPDLLSGAKAEARFALKELAIHPRGFSDPIRDFADTTIHVADGLAVVEAIRAQCRDDSLFVKRAVASLKKLPASIAVDEIDGAIVLKSPHPSYPSPLAAIFAELDPRGPYFFDGTGSITIGGATPVIDYRIHARTDRGEVSIKRYRVPIYNVAFNAIITPADATVDGISADAFSGKITGKANADFAAEPLKYTAQARLRQIDLNSLAHITARAGDKPLTVSGELNLDATIEGRGAGQAALDALTARGNVQVSKGNLFHIPVLREVLQAIDLERAATAGDASSDFSLAGRKIQLTRARISSPVLGIEGSGAVWLNGNLDLRVIVNVFSDWQKRIRELNTPVTDVVGSIAGAVQKGLNAVAKTLLYQLHVEGTIEKPQIKIIAAPVLHRQ